jgi:hypothetical protein
MGLSTGFVKWDYLLGLLNKIAYWNCLLELLTESEAEYDELTVLNG